MLFHLSEVDEAFPRGLSGVGIRTGRTGLCSVVASLFSHNLGVRCCGGAVDVFVNT